LIRPWQSPNNYSSYHLYPILIKPNLIFKTQKQIYTELRKNDIQVNLHYIPVHRQPYYENLGFKKNDFPIAEMLHREILSIPIYPTIKNKYLEYIEKTLRRVITT